MMKTYKYVLFLAAAIYMLPQKAIAIEIAEVDEVSDSIDKYPRIENDVVSLADKEGFNFPTKHGTLTFKPYLLVQTSGNYNWYDDEGLDPAYNQDNVANSGFAIPNAILGFTGRAFNIVTFNLSLNAAKSGGELLQQAWFDVAMKPSLRFRIGKFKTPFSHAYQTTLGETLMPVVPTSLTSSVILPHSLNAVNPSLATGFDVGIMMHGLLGKRWLYQVGLFNGTGSSVNTATKTISDDKHIPSLLYSGRMAYMPYGEMPMTQGSPSLIGSKKMLIAGSVNYNVESENESTDDFRAGLEFAWLTGRWYLGAEAYYMNIKFTKRQMISKAYNFIGGYAQAGYFATNKLQIAARYDMMNRNGLDTKGFINLPSVGLNYFFTGVNLKLQAMYQYMGRWGHDTQLDRDNDDLGLSTHQAVVMLQYTF